MTLSLAFSLSSDLPEPGQNVQRDDLCAWLRALRPPPRERAGETERPEWPDGDRPAGPRPVLGEDPRLAHGLPDVPGSERGKGKGG